MMVPALSTLPAIVKAPPGTISRMAPAVMTRPETDSALFSVIVTGVKICTVLPVPGTMPSLQLGAVSQLPPDNETHCTVAVAPAAGGRIDVVVVTLPTTGGPPAGNTPEGATPPRFSAACVVPISPCPTAPLLSSFTAVELPTEPVVEFGFALA